VSVSIERSTAEMMPLVTVMPPSSASALPIATTSSPTAIDADDPNGAATRPLVSLTCSTARSWVVSVPTTVAVRAVVSPMSVMETEVASSIT